MPESTLTVPAEETEQIAPPAAPSAPEAPPAAEKTPTPEAQAPDWRSILDTVDAKELRSHPKFAGIAGQRAQELFNERWTKHQQEQAARDFEEQRRKIRDEGDAYDFVEFDRKAEAQAKAQQAIDARAIADRNAVLDSIFLQLPPASQEKLKGKEFPSAEAFLHAANEELADHKAKELFTKERERIQREAKTAADKANLSKTNGSEPGLDLGGTESQNARGALSQAEWDANKNNSDWCRKNLPRMQEALANGRIR